MTQTLTWPLTSLPPGICAMCYLLSLSVDCPGNWLLINNIQQRWWHSISMITLEEIVTSSWPADALPCWLWGSKAATLWTVLWRGPHDKEWKVAFYQQPGKGLCLTNPKKLNLDNNHLISSPVKHVGETSALSNNCIAAMWETLKLETH